MWYIFNPNKKLSFYRFCLCNSDQLFCNTLVYKEIKDMLYG